MRTMKAVPTMMLTVLSLFAITCTKTETIVQPINVDNTEEHFINSNVIESSIKVIGFNTVQVLVRSKVDSVLYNPSVTLKYGFLGSSGSTLLTLSNKSPFDDFHSVDPLIPDSLIPCGQSTFQTVIGATNHPLSFAQIVDLNYEYAAFLDSTTCP